MASEPQRYPNIETYREGFPEPKQAYLSGIDFAIVSQATADIAATAKYGGMKEMFIKLDKFLQDPVWALEFGPGVEKPHITISDVISALGSQDVTCSPFNKNAGKNRLFSIY